MSAADTSAALVREAAISLAATKVAKSYRSSPTWDGVPLPDIEYQRGGVAVWVWSGEPVDWDALVKTGFLIVVEDAEARFRYDTGALLLALADRADAVLDAIPPGGRGQREGLLAGTIPGWRQAVNVAATTLGRDLDPAHRVGSQVRRVDLDAFNRDAWGDVMSLTTIEGTECYAVLWDDGATALLPTHDPDATYQWRNRP